MPKWVFDCLNIVFAMILVVFNGFFVSAEFALVKVRKGRLDELVRKRRPFAETARWLFHRLDPTLSACQLGITIASLGLGWIGEPAFGRLLRPLLLSVGIVSEIWIHGVAFVVAFTAITAAHIVLGEQAPKIFSIRRPETVLLWCALPMKFFYFLSYPFMVALNASTAFVLRMVGVGSASEHEAVHSEAEIRALLSHAHKQGELSPSEHRLLNAIFEFDDLVCRKVMIPRNDVTFLDIDSRLSDCIETAKRTKHSRYPICEGSLDRIIGVIHIKDLIGMSGDEHVDLRSIMRPPRFVPETISASRLLGQFQATHQQMAFVVDEHGTVVGVVTLENVLEPIIGSVEDEFDIEQPDIVPNGPGEFIVHGGAPVELVQQKLKIRLEGESVDTFSGLLMAKTGKILNPGDRIEFADASAEVIETKGFRAIRIRVTLKSKESHNPG
ncbi:hemolysin family protein [Thermodesulfobacteriota bacterium]